MHIKRGYRREYRSANWSFNFKSKKALTENDITKLILFVKNILNDTNLNRYLPSALPSKNCFLYNDEASKEYLSYN